MSIEADNSFNEREKMLRGLPYNAMDDPDLLAGRLRAKEVPQGVQRAMSSFSAFN